MAEVIRVSKRLKKIKQKTHPEILEAIKAVYEEAKAGNIRGFACTYIDETNFICTVTKTETVGVRTLMIGAIELLRADYIDSVRKHTD